MDGLPDKVMRDPRKEIRKRVKRLVKTGDWEMFGARSRLEELKCSGFTIVLNSIYEAGNPDVSIVLGDYRWHEGRWGPIAKFAKKKHWEFSDKYWDEAARKALSQLDPEDG